MGASRRYRRRILRRGQRAALHALMAENVQLREELEHRDAEELLNSLGELEFETPGELDETPELPPVVAAFRKATGQ